MPIFRKVKGIMARQKKTGNNKSSNGANLGFEEKLWQAADKMRGHMDPAEYKHVVLGLIFLKDIPGFCKNSATEEIRAHGYVLTPGRYVGAEDIEDDGEPFDAKMKRLTAKLVAQFAESARLEILIKRNLKGIGF